MVGFTWGFWVLNSWETKFDNTGWQTDHLERNWNAHTTEISHVPHYCHISQTPPNSLWLWRNEFAIFGYIRKHSITNNASTFTNDIPFTLEQVQCFLTNNITLTPFYFNTLSSLSLLLIYLFIWGIGVGHTGITTLLERISEDSLGEFVLSLHHVCPRGQT